MRQRTGQRTVSAQEILKEPVCVASYKVCSTASRPCFTAVSCSTLNLQSSNQISQPFFWRPSSTDLFANKQSMHPHAFANMFQHFCQSLLEIVFAPYVRCVRVWDRPHRSPSAMSSAALTHYAKIRKSSAQNCKHLRRNKRNGESKTEKQCLQQPRLQTLLSPGKKFQAEIHRQPPRTLSSTKTFNTCFIARCPGTTHPLINRFWRTRKFTGTANG